MPSRSLVTQSMMTTLIACEEKARLRYLEKFSTPSTPAQSVGSAVHYGFEVGSADAAVKWLEDARGELWAEFEEIRLAEDCAVVRAIVAGGLSRWGHWPNRTEVEFRVPFRNPATGARSTRHDFAGKFDGIWMPDEYNGYNCDPVLLEIKTTSRLDSAYLDRLDLDWQISAYLAAASVIYGAKVRKIIYRICRKPTIRPRSKIKRPDGLDEKGKAKHLYSPETPAEYARRVELDYQDRPDFYFEEVEVVRTDEQIERWWHEAWEVHQRILRIENDGMTVRNPGHCLDFGRCPFFDLCRGVQDVSAFTVREDAHPELDGTNQ